MPRSPSVDRPSWRLIPGKALNHRSGAPTFRAGARRKPRVGRLSWRLTPGKALNYRSEAPTFRAGARRPASTGLIIKKIDIQI